MKVNYSICGAFEYEIENPKVRKMIEDENINIFDLDELIKQAEKFGLTENDLVELRIMAKMGVVEIRLQVV